MPRELALAYARQHLRELQHGGALEKLGIELDLSRFESQLQILAKMPTRKADGSPHPDGPLYLLFDFAHYRRLPAILRYVNPTTWEFAGHGDDAWLPLTPLQFRGKPVKFWKDHGGQGQLICHSLSGEYYWRGGHQLAADSCRWNGERRWSEALFLHDGLHIEPYYRGRHR